MDPRTPEPGAAHDPALAAALAGARAAHHRLAATLDGLDDGQARAPSRLPGWTVGHVLTHIARNAESHVRILRGALAGEHLEQYPGGHEQRAADIEAGADRPADAVVADVTRTARELEAQWAEMTPEAWQGHGLARGRPWPCRELPFFRWREVEVHHVDLGLGYEPDDWPDGYVSAELPRLLTALPDRLSEPQARRRLMAWLLGRAEEPGPLQLDPWQSRPGHYTARPATPTPVGERQQISSGSPYELTIGFSRAVRVGDRVVVSGTGPVWPDGSCPDDAGRQAARCFEIVADALAEAGASLDQVVRIRMFLTSADDADAVSAVHGRLLGDVRPAATLVVVAGFVDPRWKVEVEAEAIVS